MMSECDGDDNVQDVDYLSPKDCLEYVNICRSRFDLTLEVDLPQRGSPGDMLSVLLSIKLNLKRDAKVNSILEGQQERKVCSVLLFVGVDGGRGPCERVLGASNLVLLSRRKVCEGDPLALDTYTFEWQ